MTDYQQLVDGINAIVFGLGFIAALIYVSYFKGRWL